ncbi:Ig-like domain-containing protein [Leptolyngbya sp. 7M]|uniref:Ig-like domain-containing protein n=1 Tax=Leptolyngbya sp. 7M TaxID=2812896 RepID=UPI001B8D6EA9|nr:Ig-like domain-containing protein [Leptolyngbya sp. 7M]QYO63529.1 VCBS domain-containing protein [Leptolyngbya sp. 7M]
MPTIDFTQLPPSSAPSFQRNGITIRTDPDRKLVISQDSDSLGLGVDDATIDEGESIFVSFNQGAASKISYMLDSAATSDGDDLYAEAELEAFDVNGKSLGVVPLSVSAFDPINNVSAAFDGQLISRFRLTQIESARIGSLSFTPVPVLVARADTVTTTEDAPITFNVRKNDTFLLSGSPTISVNTNGLQGKLTNNGNGSFTYNPGSAFQSLTAGQTASTSFQYTLRASGRSSTATVTLTITGLNEASTAQSSDTITGPNKGSGTSPAIGKGDDLLTGGLQSGSGGDSASATQTPETGGSELGITTNPIPEVASLIAGLFGSANSTESSPVLGAGADGLTAAFPVAQPT